MKHLSLFWYTTLQTLLWLKGRYIEALKFDFGIPRYKPCYGLKGRYIEALDCGIPRYKPYYGSRGGTLKQLSLFWYTTLQTLLWLKERYIEALKFDLVYHVTNLVMDQGEVH